jgi:hypothetical protein
MNWSCVDGSLCIPNIKIGSEIQTVPLDTQMKITSQHANTGTNLGSRWRWVVPTVENAWRTTWKVRTAVEKIKYVAPIGIRSPSRPARNVSLQETRCSGPPNISEEKILNESRNVATLSFWSVSKRTVSKQSLLHVAM